MKRAGKNGKRTGRERENAAVRFFILCGMNQRSVFICLQIHASRHREKGVIES